MTEMRLIYHIERAGDYMCDYNDMRTHLLGESRYELNGTPTAAQHGVATPRNRITIPRCCALFCTTVDAPFNSSNCGF